MNIEINKNNSISISNTYVLTTPLQPSEVNAVRLFKKSLEKSIDTYTFKANGIESAPQCIWRLQKKGALINKTYSNVKDIFGGTHKRVAHYSLVGWEEKAW